MLTPRARRRTPRLVKKLTTTIAAITTAMLTLTSCASISGPERQAVDLSEPVEGGTLIYAEVAPVNQWQTQGARFYERSNLLHQLLDRLTYFDAEAKEPVPWVAESWEISDDYTQFTFHIKEGITFSDGTPLDAQAVQANLEVFAFGIEDSQIPSNPDFAAYESSEIIDELTLKVQLNEPDAYFLRSTSAVTAGLVSPATLELDNEGQNNVETIYGSGPFVFKSQVPEQEVVLAARKDYAWAPETFENQGRAYLDEVVVKYLPEIGNRTGAVATDQVHLARGIQPADEQNLKDTGSQLLIADATDLTANMASVRIGSGRLEDNRVRQALQIGIDRELIHQVALSDSYEISGSILNKNAPGYVDLSEHLKYDPERANQLLDEAGWDQKDEDGIRIKDGQRMEITVSSSNNSVVIRPVFEAIEQQWRKIGVQLVNRAADNTFLPTAQMDENVELFGTRAFYYGGLGRLYEPDQNMYLQHQHEELNKILKAERTETDPEKQLERLADVQRAVVVDEAVNLVLWDEIQIYGAAPNTHVEFTTGTAPIFHEAYVVDYNDPDRAVNNNARADNPGTAENRHTNHEPAANRQDTTAEQTEQKATR